MGQDFLDIQFILGINQENRILCIDLFWYCQILTGEGHSLGHTVTKITYFSLD